MKPILITGGDPGGIGYEILLKTLPEIRRRRILDQLIFIANPGALKFYAKILNLPLSWEGVNLIPVGPEDFRPQLGEDSAENGEVAILSLDRAIDLIRKGESQALLTGPISKKAVVLSGKPGFTGHTTYLARAFDVEDYTMVLANPDFGVGLVTIHVPLSRVASLITASKVMATVRNLHKLAIRWGEGNQTIWVCGLNPHAGEGGELGREEEEIILPTVQKLKAEGIPAEGPFPADALFKKALTAEGRYFVSMYHDQGLIPVKMLGKNRTVNMTLGLPFFRISVEHGTAYDIAGKNRADASSFLTALDIVCQYQEI